MGGQRRPPIADDELGRRRGLWGVDPQGTVWRSDGDEWTRVGALSGEPEALLATADALYAASYDDDGVTGIYHYTDDGRTWHGLYRDTE